MENIGQFFRLGMWEVKPENASDFIAAWQASAEWSINISLMKEARSCLKILMLPAGSYLSVQYLTLRRSKK